jgi:hypothetical protein
MVRARRLPAGALPPTLDPPPKGKHAFALPLAKLRVARAKLLDNGCVDPYFDALHIDSLWLIQSAHLGLHLGGLESIACASLSLTGTGRVDNFRENPNEFIPV